MKSLISGEEVIFCIGGDLKTKPLLQLQLEAEFEDFQTQNPQSKKIQVKSLKSYHPHKKHLDKTHVFMDEVEEISFQNYAKLQTKSLWVAVSFDQYSKDFKDANEAMNYFKSLYSEWYIPFFNYILRTTKNIAEELKKPSRINYRDNWNNESKLNNVLDIPQNIQEGPKPVTFEDLSSDQFCKKVLSTFKEIGKNDVALVVMDKYAGVPVKSISSKTKFSNNYNVSKKYPDYGHTLAFLSQIIPDAGRELPLIWIEDCSCNSKKDQIKDWIRGKSKCDLITDRILMHGFEASTCISFSSSTVSNVLSRTRVKHINFYGKYEDFELPGS